MAKIDDDMQERATEHLVEAWNNALSEDLPRELIVSVALALAYGELVSIYGQEAAETIAARFPEQIRQGNFQFTGEH